MSYLGFSSSKKLCIVDWRGTVWQLFSSCCVIVGCNGQEKSCCRNILHVVPGVDPVHASCTRRLLSRSKHLGLLQCFTLQVKVLHLRETISTYGNCYHLESWAFASHYFSAVLSRGSIPLLLGIVEGLMHMAQLFQSSATEDMAQENKVPWENCKSPGGLPKTREKPWNSSLDKT